MNTRNAFTLIEVLLAVFIIGLGSIGLFALFAGVASQQARSAELTRAVGQAQALLGAMEGRVGPIGEWTGTSGQPINDPIFGAPIVRGVWYPASSYFGTTDPSLSINPRGTQMITLGRYFVAPKVEEEIYTNPAVFVGGMYQPAEGGLGLASFTTANFANATSLVGNAQIVRLPNSRAALGTVEIEFWKSDTATGVESLAFAVSDLDLVPNVTDDMLVDTWVLPLPPNPMSNPPPSPPNTTPGPPPYVLFNYAELVEDAQDPTLAGIDGFNLAGLVDADEWVSSIRVRYAHRADRLLGLGERLITTPDETRPSGRRATVGATAMYRVTPRGRSQFVTIAYTVNPLDRQGDFIPPERPIGRNDATTNGLLRVSNDYELFYDTTRNEYYMTWANDDFALVEGDVVIVGGELMPPSGSPLNRLGADNPVRVSRVLTVGTGRRAYLDDTPRVMGRSMAVATNANPLYRVYTLRREVEVVDQDGVLSRWELRPVLYQTLDVQ